MSDHLEKDTTELMHCRKFDACGQKVTLDDWYQNIGLCNDCVQLPWDLTRISEHALSVYCHDCKKLTYTLIGIKNTETKMCYKCFKARYHPVEGLEETRVGDYLVIGPKGKLTERQQTISKLGFKFAAALSLAGL